MVNKKLATLIRKYRKTEADYAKDPMSKLAREQFKRLTERGIDLPVVLL